MRSLYKSFRAVVKRHRFIEPNTHVLAAVSGGVDSMVLAHLLVALKQDIDFKLSLAHVNYGLRGAESYAQEKLVQAFAEENNLSCFVARPDGIVSQAAARDFRYHYFVETSQQIGAGKIAVAHHLEDQVETILGQWLRGSSVRGLGGMKRKRTMDYGRWTMNSESIDSQVHRPSSMVYSPSLIRPLLNFSKDQLRQYAQQSPVPFLDDSSNASPKYWRNRIRHELLPVIQNLRPQALKKITRLGEEIRELSDFLETAAKEWLKNYGRQTPEGYWLPRPGWIKLPRTLRLEVLHQAVLESQGSAKNLKRDHLERCEQLSSGGKSNGYYSLPGSLRFVRSGDDLMVTGSGSQTFGFSGSKTAFSSPSSPSSSSRG